MPTPKPSQIEGAKFLASRKVALLADAPRVGKTGAAIMACDHLFAKKILVITKSSARAQWGREFREWSIFGHNVQVVYSGTAKLDPQADAIVVGWGMVFVPALFKQLMAREYEVIILDESHEAKHPDRKRTRAVYGSEHDPELPCLKQRTEVLWCLSGTPIANAPCDIHPMLKAFDPVAFPETYSQFTKRYCVLRKKYVGGRWIEYPIKGQNEDELRERLKGLWLRRSQQDVGILAPIYSVFALHVDKLPPELTDDDAIAVMESIRTGGEINELHLGTIRRVTGLIMAPAIVEAAKEALDDGLEKLVIMAWHSDVIDTIRAGLSAYGVVGIDGRTPSTQRDSEVQQFRNGTARVFVGQILAAGEAIDLSAAPELWFAEISTVPKDMAQAAMRVTNHNQKQQALVRVCALADSITEALFEIVTRKVESITKIMEK